VDEYGKQYPLPALWKEKQPARLSEAHFATASLFRIESILQTEGQPIGVLSATFTTDHIASLVRTEMYWIGGISALVLLCSAFGILIDGKRLTARLKLLQSRALAVGSGELGEPIAVTGADEISDLTSAFNQMIHNLAELRQKDRESTGQIQSLNSELSAQLKKVEELREQLIEENSALREQLGVGETAGNIIGAAGGLRELMEQAGKLASLPVTVLIRGESGTGKELLARYLHDAGARKEKPFIAVNCAALPMTLIESELFGHEKGSFTGATSQKKGKFELAHKGTLFLDEVGELPAEAQAKLLRALQQNEVVRVGGDKPITVDVRVVAATNRNLDTEVNQGKFRNDLYYRLKVVELRCPPLRERLEDLPALAQHFIEQYARKLGKAVVGISPSALNVLSSYRWPGNIRELENMIARAVALAATQVLGPEDFSILPSDGKGRPADKSAAGVMNFAALSLHDLDGKGLETFLDACERSILVSAMETYKTQKDAADALNLTPVKLHRLLKKHGMIQVDTAQTFQK
jgi:transcriptional regulator with GAF, ATPase, and Fis domain